MWKITIKTLALLQTLNRFHCSGVSIVELEQVNAGLVKCVFEALRSDVKRIGTNIFRLVSINLNPFFLVGKVLYEGLEASGLFCSWFLFVYNSNTGVEVLSCCLYFSIMILEPNVINVKIPLELRRVLWRNRNITLTTTSFSLVAFGICTKPISSAVPDNKNNFIIILWNFNLSFFASRLWSLLFSRFVNITIIRTKRKLP